MARVLLICALVLCFVGSQVDALTKPSSIKFVNNAYSGIVVGIHRDIPENPELIDRIKEMFIDGSAYLYTATRKRAYFKNVTIVLPLTWSSQPNYRQASNESFDLADVIVAPPNPRWAPNPYTKQYQGCGKVGVNIHFMDTFLLDQEIEQYYGPLGRTLVHEWGHYRWGLFNEYADPVGDPDNYQEFYYSPRSQTFEGVRCSYGVIGRPVKFYPGKTPPYGDCAGDKYVGYEEGCVFVPDEEGHSATASIMFGRQFFEQVVEFCDTNGNDERTEHNKEAPNKHNRLCDYRSAWSVMKNTPDFYNENNPPVDLGPSDIIPEFFIVQHEQIRVVLVLDASNSMDGTKFTQMVTQTANYISQIVTDGSAIGIVTFNDGAFIDSELVTIVNDADRNTLLEKLPIGTELKTCIGCGLLKGLEVLRGTSREDDPAGGVLLLLSDGKETIGPYIDDVKYTMAEEGVIVDAIAFTQKADEKMFELSDLTGGKAYYYSGEAGDSTLYDALVATMERGEIDDHQRRVQLTGDTWELDPAEERSGGVYLDSTIGERTYFTFIYTLAVNKAGVRVVVTQPDGTQLNSTYPGYTVDLDYKRVDIAIEGIAQPGAWSFLIINQRTSNPEQVSFTVTSYASDPDVEPILITSELSGSTTNIRKGDLVIAYAEIRQGFSPIVYAEVWATITRPGSSPIDVELLDNGAGADITKNDGIYSRYFTEITNDGYYGIKISVFNNGTALVIDSSPASRAIPNIRPEDANNLPEIGGTPILPPWTPPSDPTGTLAPSFSRADSAGSSKVTVPKDYVPGDDYLAPGRIFDLKASAPSFDEATVTLTWMSTGDDLDNGAASSYDLRIADTIPELQDNFMGSRQIEAEDVLEGNLMNPQTFGNLETFVIRVPIWENATIASYAFAVQAIDDVGKRSDTSNVIQATLRAYIPPPSNPPEGLSTGAVIGIVVGVIAAIFIIMVIIIVVVLKTKDSNTGGSGKKTAPL